MRKEVDAVEKKKEMKKERRAAKQKTEAIAAEETGWVQCRRVAAVVRGIHPCSRHCRREQKE